MNQIRSLVVRLGTCINPGLLSILVIALNVYWVVILAVIGQQFLDLNGYPLPDLQNSLSPQEIMTPAKFMTQISSYSPEAISLYWNFFILDNIMPHLSFGIIAVLWVYFWKSNQNRLYSWLLSSFAMLIPLAYRSLK